MTRVNGVLEQTLVGNFNLNSHKIQNDMLETNTTRINRYTWDLQVSTKLQTLEHNTYSINGYNTSPGAARQKKSTHAVSLDRPEEKLLLK